MALKVLVNSNGVALGGPSYKAIKRKNAKGLYAGRVDLDKANRRALTVLDREIAYLMMASHVTPLDKDQSAALIAYCKLIRDLLKSKAEEDAGKSVAELEKLAGKVLS
jgi:hypothetical protein